MELMQASRQWAKRPPEERFTNLTEMLEASRAFRNKSLSRRVANRDIRVAPVKDDPAGLAVTLNGMPSTPNNWAFGQLCSLVGAPAGYLKRLPTPMIADCLNYGFQIDRKIEEIGTLTVNEADGMSTMVAATGPDYGRIWNDSVLEKIIDRFGDGQTGKFTVPGEFGKAVTVDKDNTTLYRSDRDMFLFLADEKNRIEIASRRDNKPGGLARGFFLWNSEVGASSIGVSTFLFDYTCSNRIVWGAEQFAEIKIRHTVGAPHRWMEEIAPALEIYAEGSTHSIVEAITAARGKRIGDGDAVTAFLTKRFNSANTAKAIQLAHIAEEGRPIETLWDATTGITAYAKGIQYQDRRIEVEREGGKVMALAM